MLDPRLARRGAGAARLALCQAAYVTHSHRSAHLSRPGSCPDGVYVSPDTNDTLRTHAPHSHTGWNGVVFVRSGAYASGVFRFCIQFAMDQDILVTPSVFLPQILLHPLVEVRRPYAHAARRRTP